MSNQFTLSWKPKDFERKMQKHWKHLKEPIADVMKQGQSMVSRQAASNMQKHQYTGSAISSILGEGSKTLNELYGSTGFKVGTYEISALIQEFGRGAGKRMPPVGSIMEWLNASQPEAYNVARIIGITGIKKTQPILKAKNTVLPQIRRMLADAMDKVLKNLGF